MSLVRGVANAVTDMFHHLGFTQSVMTASTLAPILAVRTAA